MVENSMNIKKFLEEIIVTIKDLLNDYPNIFSLLVTTLEKLLGGYLNIIFLLAVVFCGFGLPVRLIVAGILSVIIIVFVYKWFSNKLAIPKYERELNELSKKTLTNNALIRKEAIPQYFIYTAPTTKIFINTTPSALNEKAIFIFKIAQVFGSLSHWIGSILMYITERNFFTDCFEFLFVLGFVASQIAVLAEVIHRLGVESKKLYIEKMQKLQLLESEKTIYQGNLKPTDEQMDNWLNQDLEEIKRDALQKLDINEEDIITPPGFEGQGLQSIMFIGPSQKAELAIGQDLNIRFSIYDILIVYLTQYHLAAYKCTLDLATQIRTKESTQEYHYTDVVSVSTKTGSDLALTVNGETKSIANYQQFALSVASGESITVATPTSFSEQILAIIKDGKLPDSGADKAIRAIRSQLREKKKGAIE
jgi:hypothetical protein